MSLEDLVWIRDTPSHIPVPESGTPAQWDLNTGQLHCWIRAADVSVTLVALEGARTVLLRAWRGPEAFDMSPVRDLFLDNAVLPEFWVFAGFP